MGLLDLQDLGRWSRQRTLDEIVDEARKIQEEFNGPEYWRKPVETTGPKPRPDGHWVYNAAWGYSSWVPDTDPDDEGQDDGNSD